MATIHSKTVRAGSHRPSRQGEPLDFGGSRAPSGGWRKGEVERRISDWVRRLAGLYDQLDGWIAGLPDVSARREGQTQLIEHPMKEAGVRPRTVPAWTALRGKKRVSFSPSSLWILGANGRVNVITNSGAHVLVDLGGVEGGPSDWRLVDTSRRNMHRPFDRAVLLELLRE